jgi:UDP-glucose 4-epimerase
MTILVTGGTGYIGSHTVVELINNKYDVVIIDNLSNSKIDVVDKIEKITGIRPKFYLGDVCDKDILNKIFEENKIDAVIHFAGYKAVGESVEKPLMYYRNNIDSTLSLCEVMKEHKCMDFVFSSSATVYGDPERLPLDEKCRLSTTNPYGTTKLFIEQILKDICISDKNFSVAVLRYFNPVGGHESGLLGENPNGIPNNLVPYIVKVACGELDHLTIFGNDYDTEDGTGVRDYIHVVDLAKGHVNAIEYVVKNKGIDYFNLGTGRPYSVLELVNTFSRINDVEVKYEFGPRRSGDIASCYADCSYAMKKLGWEAEHGLDDMLKSAYQFWIKNK